MTGPSWLVHWARCKGTRDFCPALVAKITKYAFSHRIHYFSSFVPIAHKAGQAVVLGHLSPNICLWL
jgi:hypothetical protein